MKPKKSKIGNPALIASAAANSETSKQVSSTLPFLIKTAVIIGLVGVSYRIVTTRFTKWNEVSSYPAANISFAQAKSKAESIYNSTGYFGYGNDFENIKSQLQGVNYNGFIRIYNAFNQKGNIVTGYSDLVSFLHSKLDNEQIQQLRFLLSGAFLKTSPATTTELKPVEQNIKFLGV